MNNQSNKPRRVEQPIPHAVVGRTHKKRIGTLKQGSATYSGGYRDSRRVVLDDAIKVLDRSGY
jgi:hypothetical protein